MLLVLVSLVQMKNKMKEKEKSQVNGNEPVLINLLKIKLSKLYFLRNYISGVNGDKIKCWPESRTQANIYCNFLFVETNENISDSSCRNDYLQSIVVLSTDAVAWPFELKVTCIV